MVWKIVLFAISVSASLLVSCIGEDPNASDNDFENTLAMCTDGDDNDGDFHYDCYDPDCRALDSTRRLDGDSAFCHYEDYHEIIDREQSSVVRRSSSSVARSSSSAVPGLAGFPYEVAGDPTDSVQILALFRKTGSSRVVLAGRMRQHGLFGIIDTAGKVLEAADDLRSSEQPPQSMATGVGAMEGTLIFGLDTNSTGDYTVYGSSLYENRNFATYFFRQGNAGAWSMEFWWKQMFVFTGFTSLTSKCFVTNSLDTAFVVVDDNLSDNSIPYPSIHPLKTNFVAGTVVGEDCAAVGTRTTTDSTQIRYARINKHNDIEADQQVTTGSVNEVAYGIASTGGNTYLAVRIDGEPRLLVLNASDALTNDGSSQNLGVGTPYRLKVIRVGSATRILMLGSRAGKGMLWLFGTDGNLVASAAIASAGGFTDAIQLGDGNLLVSGWTSNGSTSGTTGVVEKISTGLALVEE